MNTSSGSHPESGIPDIVDELLAPDAANAPTSATTPAPDAAPARATAPQHTTHTEPGEPTEPGRTDEPEQPDEPGRTDEPAEPSSLVDTLELLGQNLSTLELPLEIIGVDKDRELQHKIVRRLEDHIVPRLRETEAPLLAVVGGSTGAGKSTLINSILGQDICAAGVLRPTTRSPMLVHHPDDTAWFQDQRILPRLARVMGPVTEGSGASTFTGTITTLRLAASPAMPKGLALLDAPDIDSMVSANRELAQQLLAAADLWIFVTTAARYADAVPWDLLASASDRDAAVAMVLNRVPEGTMHEIKQDLDDRLQAGGLGEAPLFGFHENALVDGKIPAEHVESLHNWIHKLAQDAEARQQVILQTLHGSLRTTTQDTKTLLQASVRQAAGQEQLHVDVDRASKGAIDRLQHALVDGAVLRGEVMTRWHDFIGTAQFFRKIDSKLSRARDIVTSKILGKPAPEESLRLALHSGIVSVIISHAEQAGELTEQRWSTQTFGTALLQDNQELLPLNPDALQDAEQLVRDWQRAVTTMVAEQTEAKHAMVRILSLGVNALAVVLMVVVFAGTAFLPLGLEVATGTATAAMGQRLLESLFGESVVRKLAKQAAEDLQARSEEFICIQQSRFHGILARTGVDETAPKVLTGLLNQMEEDIP